MIRRARGSHARFGFRPRTLPLGLANLSLTAQYHTDYGPLFAGLMPVTLHILLTYVLLQRHIVKGVTAGALKG
jgi:ABC-type glycerol-3-phosphate transport system permease component